MSTDPTGPANPFADGGVFVARCRAMAVRAKRLHGDATYRCPSCRDLGWIFGQGITFGGAKNVEVAQRCVGPAMTGCPQLRHEEKVRPKAKASPRGRMD
jgi:hypothetical protein